MKLHDRAEPVQRDHSAATVAGTGSRAASTVPRTGARKRPVADVGEGLQVAGDRRDVPEELAPLVDAHLEDVGDRAALVLDLERLAIVAVALADLARHVHVGQEGHLDLDLAVAGAVLASAP